MRHPRGRDCGASATQRVGHFCVNREVRSTLPSAPQCVEVPCRCGDCYSRGSLIGDWLWAALRRFRGALRRRWGGWPGRYGRRGELLVPEWVVSMYEQPRR